MNVLISAYTCRPNEGSEPEVGWNILLQVLRRHNVFLITKSKNKDSLKKLNATSLNVYYVDLPDYLRFLKTNRITFWIYYYLWQYFAYVKAKRVLSKNNIDIAHHVTLMSYRMNFVPYLNIPSIVGPVGGLQLTPNKFRRIAGHYFKEGLREALILKLKISPLYNIFLRKLEVLILTHSMSVNYLPKTGNVKNIVLQIGASDFTDYKNETATKDKEVLDIYWGGILERWKGFSIILKALQYLKSDNIKFRLHITGKGKDEKFLLNLIKKYNLENHVTLYGYISKSSQLKIMKKCHIIAFTSLHETTGLILLEAMSLGLVPVILDWAGPSEIVTAECGLKIKPKNFNTTSLEFSNAIKKLYIERDRLSELSINAKNRILENYNWNIIGDKINEIYLEILSNNK